MTSAEIFQKILLIICFATASKGKIIQEPTSNETYSETPCEIRQLSVFRDSQGNLWGIGEGNLWWFNATNLSWSLLPILNSSWAASDAWKVTCGDPKKYVSLQGPQTTLILHLPWQHWQQVDIDSSSPTGSSSIDPEAYWCHLGTLFTTDFARKNLYVLDENEARWHVWASSSAGKDKIFNGTNQDKRTVVKPWPSVNGLLYMMESSQSGSHIIFANVTRGGWSVVKKRDKNDIWPELSGLVVPWIRENEELWAWKEGEVWFFNASSLEWRKIKTSDVGLPQLENILSTWTKDDNTFCFLSRTEKCVGQYSSSSTSCWANFVAEASVNTSLSSLKSISQNEISVAATTTRIIAAPPLQPTRSTTSTSATETPIFVSIHNVVNKHSLLAALPSELDEQQEEVSANDISVTVVPYPKNSNPWHQHTSVFGSVIFFGTSITIFGVVGSFWCVRRCVHFPKEALLLRDPPSVRYTAIPDSVAYDARGQPSAATYAIIPDSIA